MVKENVSTFRALERGENNCMYVLEDSRIILGYSRAEKLRVDGAFAA